MCKIFRHACRCCRLFYINHPNCFYIKNHNILCHVPCNDLNIKLCFDCQLICNYCKIKCKENAKHDYYSFNKRSFFEYSITRFNCEFMNEPFQKHYLKLICRRYFLNRDDKIKAEKWQKKMILWNFKTQRAITV